jgi:D-aspartate ligase
MHFLHNSCGRWTSSSTPFGKFANPRPKRATAGGDRLKHLCENPAIVLGDNLTGLGVVRALHPRGVPVFVLDPFFRGRCAKSSWARKIESPCVSSSQILSFLGDLRNRFDKTPVLFPTIDATVQLLSRHRDEIQDYSFIIPDRHIVDTLLDKARFASYAAENDLRIPATFCIDNEDQLGAILEQVEYPCLLKPSLRDKVYDDAGLRKGFKIACRDELWDAYRQMNHYCPSVVVQQWIEGGDGDIHFCLMYSNNYSRVIASVTGRKIRQYPPECGSTSLAEGRRNDVVEQESRRIFEQIGFRGIGSMEYKLDSATGQYYITEPTVGRVNLQSYLAVANGVNIPYLTYLECCGQDTGRENVKPTYGVKWIHEYNDLASSFYYLRRRQLTLNDWYSSLSGDKAYAVWSRRDPKPALQLGGDLLEQFFYQLGKRIPLVGRASRTDSWKERLVTPLLQAGLPLVRSLSAHDRKLRILIYHRVMNNGPGFMYDDEVVSCSPFEFERQIRYLKKYYNIIGFRDLYEHIEANSLPQNPLIITFDDGYRDNYDHAYAILKKHGVKATVFVTVDHIRSGELFWWDRVAYCLKRDRVDGEIIRERINTLKRLPNDERLRRIEENYPIDGGNHHDQLLTWAQIEEMSRNGVEIGSHTMTHPTLAHLNDPQEIEYELMESKRILEDRLHQNILAMSYPTGGPDSYSDEIIRHVKRLGYSFAATYVHGTNDLRNGHSEFYQLKRIDADKQPLHKIRIKLAYPGLFGKQLRRQESTRTISTADLVAEP